ncbi:DUF1559 domain-containing protein [Tundrisphaera sp. TA3]|uniref:DUF1559 family PulG-like putative transporter n=1 Tax=Tundrisphaera sp. TA3 TaxID=3435775 RepID=UPI003EB7F48E
MKATLASFNLRRLMAWVAVAAVLFGMIAWLVRIVDEARRSANSAQCVGHLAQIALALHNYHEVYGRFPPAYIADPEGRPMHSWRVLILQFLEPGLYGAYDFAEPWDGPNNSRLALSKPNFFACPNGPDYGGHSNRTNYLAIVGPGTAFPGGRSTSLSDVSDPTGDTIMIAEVADSGINWMEPRDLDVRTIDAVDGGPKQPHISSHDRVAHVVCVDGSVRVLPGSIAPSEARGLATIGGGEPTPSAWVR